jgi:hypothetical protein
MLADGELFLEAHVLGEKPPRVVGYCIRRHGCLVVVTNIQGWSLEMDRWLSPEDANADPIGRRRALTVHNETADETALVESIGSGRMLSPSEATRS